MHKSIKNIYVQRYCNVKITEKHAIFGNTNIDDSERDLNKGKR